MNRNFGGVVSEINAVLDGGDRSFSSKSSRRVSRGVSDVINIANPLVIIIRVAKASVINLL